MNRPVKTALVLAVLAAVMAGTWTGWARLGLQWSLTALSSFCL
jgi:hypothetical protein